MVSKSLSSCLCFPSARMAGVCHHVQIESVFVRASSSSLGNLSTNSYLRTVIVTVVIDSFIFCTTLPLIQFPDPRVPWLEILLIFFHPRCCDFYSTWPSHAHLSACLLSAICPVSKTQVERVAWKLSLEINLRSYL